MALRVRVDISVAAALINNFDQIPGLSVVSKTPMGLFHTWEFDLNEDARDVDATVVNKLDGQMQSVRLPDTIVVDGGVDLLNSDGTLKEPRVVVSKHANIRVVDKSGTRVRIATNNGEGWVDENMVGFDDRPDLPYRVLNPDGTIFGKYATEEEAKSEAGRRATAIRSKVRIYHIGRPGRFIGVDPLA